MVNPQPLGSPWDVFASLTKGNIDAAGMGRDEDSESAKSDTLEEVSQFSAKFSDSEESSGPVPQKRKSNVIESESDDEPVYVRSNKPTSWIELDSDGDYQLEEITKKRRRQTDLPSVK